MNKASVEKLSDRITWDFSLIKQGFVSRYGRLGFVYYRQYTPGGLVADQLHPPKPITEKLYLMAERQYKLANGSA